MTEWLHLNEINQFTGKPLNEYVSVMREHVTNCPQCQDVLFSVDKGKAAIEAYGHVNDRETRNIAMSLVRSAEPTDDLYYELVVEALIRQHLVEEFPHKTWKPS